MKKIILIIIIFVFFLLISPQSDAEEIGNLLGIQPYICNPEYRQYIEYWMHNRTYIICSRAIRKVNQRTSKCYYGKDWQGRISLICPPEAVLLIKEYKTEIEVNFYKRKTIVCFEFKF